MLNIIKKIIKKTLFWLRIHIMKKGSLPDFIIIGAQKSGTTSLFSYLSQHPQILPSFKKEVHFFDGGLNPEVDSYQNGINWYRLRFPKKKKSQKVFEASPFYIFNPLVPKRIFDHIPKVKIIAILRNPTERAISQYFHSQSGKNESLSISDAFEEEENRLRIAKESGDYKIKAYREHSYKNRGLYKEQLERFFKYFPKQQILVLNFDELINQPEAELEKTFEFVGVEKKFKVTNLKAKNISSNRKEVRPDIYDYLNKYFHNHNMELYDLLGKNFGWEEK